MPGLQFGKKITLITVKITELHGVKVNRVKLRLLQGNQSVTWAGAG